MIEIEIAKWILPLPLRILSAPPSDAPSPDEATTRARGDFVTQLLLSMLPGVTISDPRDEEAKREEEKAREKSPNESTSSESSGGSDASDKKVNIFRIVPDTHILNSSYLLV